MQFRNSFLRTYLEYVEDTESPRVFHIWSALTTMGACLGRRAYFNFGIGPVYANMYTLLVGPPGVRKSVAVGIATRRLRHSTGVRFAPSDTSGQRQGLLAAMENKAIEGDAKLAAALEGSLEVTADELLAAVGSAKFQINPKDSHVVFADASEFTSFIGHNNLDMITFLGKMWDGEPYDYRLKNSQMTLNDPLLTILGGSTPTNIASALPVEAVGQGFMSRIILVYGREKYKRIPRPTKLSEALEQQIDQAYSTAFHEMDGEFKETDGARKALDDLYDVPLKIEDHRFVYYAERRHTHLIKLGMCMAAARGSMEINQDDVLEADIILRTTESFMPEALGEYGMSPLSRAKQHLVDFLRASKEPITAGVLYSFLHKDIRQADFKQVLADLINAGKVMQVTIPGVGQAYTYKVPKAQLTEELLNGLADPDPEPGTGIAAA